MNPAITYKYAAESNYVLLGYIYTPTHKITVEVMTAGLGFKEKKAVLTSS